MGNNPSKPEGKAASSPVTGHSSNSTSSANQSQPRREPRISGYTTKNSTAQAKSQQSPSQPLSPSPSPSPHLQQQPHPYPHSHSQSYSHSHSHSYSHPINSPSPRQIQEDKMGNEQSRQKWKEKKEQSTPVRVPRGTDPRRQRGPDSQFEPSGPPRDPNHVPHTNLNYPPRLPLPIEEEVHTPGSPIFTPAGILSTLEDDELEGPLPRQTSIVSNTTIDDDDIGDELQPFSLDESRRTVPTVVEWKQGGDKVYVTGTFTSWSRKFRMNRDPATNVLSTILQLPPGTHHVKFIVDGEMQLSKELPTAVDYTNILVNYIEVSADDLPRTPPAEEKIPEGIFPPQVLPQTIEARDHAPDSIGKTQSVEGNKTSEPAFWGDDIPKYLSDLDQTEQSQRYQRAARGVAEFATPPSLPLFLGKSILNGTTPMKDDSSVLNMPNHTVLNHLATSSIKNQVLATSVTTRYKRKYVTSIMYKTTTENGD